MNASSQRTIVHLDGYTRVCLTAITVLLTLLVIGLWAGPLPGSSPAGAADAKGIYGPTVQRTKQLQAAQETNQKLDRLMTLLTSGQVKVVIVEEGAKGGRSNGVRSRRK